MKARTIRRLRTKLKYFLVLKSDGLFGDFPDVSLESYTEVMGKNPKNAAQRYMRRNHSLKLLNNWDETPDETSETFAKLKVLPKDTPFRRFITYWK